MSQTNVQQPSWGRAWEVQGLTLLGTFLLLATTPFAVFYFYIACSEFGGSLLLPAQKLYTGELTLASLWNLLPALTAEAWMVYGAWFLLQLFCALALPDLLHKVLKGYRGGLCKGAVTPAGNQLTYNINGLQAWVIAHALFLSGAFLFGWFSPTIIIDNFGPMLWVVNIVGNSVALFVYVKAYLFPSYPEDRKFSGNFLYDFYMGIELNPRIKNFDFKLFFNGRPGIVAWTLINLSFAAKQYQLYGTVTNSMILVNVLQAAYVIYFFWNERWYLNTIDIHHDHFGWMLAWGDCVWLPYMYTLQGLYLVFNPVELSTPYALFVLGVGVLGYTIFHLANRQKDRFRESDGNTKIWGKDPEYIPVSYSAADGSVRKTKLLTSGFWGIARHFNYTGDIIGCLSYSLACGFGHILPYFYFFFLTTLLVHRCIRDEKRLEMKYGEGWKRYCEKVPYRIIPGVW